jgi:AraC-like DNA-binding protein
LGKDDFDLFPSRLAESFRRDDEEVIGNGQPKLKIVELFFTEQGIPDWFTTNKLPIHNRAGELVGSWARCRAMKAGVRGWSLISAGSRCGVYPGELSTRGVGQELSHVVYLSPRQLHRKFVDTFGVSPQAFIIKLRVQAACEALQREGSQIADVATDLGFCDQSSFTQLFQKHVGLTPLKYQKRFRTRR